MSGRARLHVTVGAPAPEVVRCEAEIFGLRYGDTAEDLARDYGDYADRTLWLSVRDESGAVLGVARLIVPGALPTKTLVDLSREPWCLAAADVADVVAQVGLDPDACLDIATIGVRPDLGADGARIAAALLHGIVLTTRVNGIPWAVAVLHVLVRRILASTGLVMHPLPGTRPGVYEGSPGFQPVYANMDRVLDEQRLSDPAAHRRVVMGDIEGVDVPAPEAFLLPLRRSVDLRDHARARTA